MWRAEFFAFRVPALPFATVDGLDRARLRALAARPDVAAALELASPDLVARLRERPDDEAAERALVRYVTRMATRPTPFGLFAGCGTGAIGSRTRIELPDRVRWRRHTRLDGELVAQLGERSSARREDDTAYRVGDRWRSVVVRDGRHQLVEHRREPGSVPAPPALTGPAQLDGLLADADADTAEQLREVRSELAALDAAREAPRLDGLLGALGVERTLQVDLTVPPCGATLGQAVVDDVGRAIELLRRIAPPEPEDALDRFRAAFVERYEEREVPLLEALDDDFGPGFGGADPAPLLNGVTRTATPATVTFGAREERLLALLTRGSHEVVLKPDDIEALSADTPARVPGAVAALVTLAGKRTVVHHVHGPSGARLLGRFCHADPVLTEHVRAHVRAEEALDPDAIHAEIVHLPGGRMANLLARPVLREWELEWLGRSGAPTDRRLAASDLLLSVCDGRFVLRSQRLGRRVVPRLTSAHDYTRGPAVYRFLGALQAEGVTAGLAWTWGPFAAARFTPRVRWGRVVLAPATWRVDPTDLPELPRWVCIAEGDNKLVLDLENPLCRAELARRRGEVVLEEVFVPDGPHALELVIPLIGAPVPAPAARPAPTAARRTFAPGSEWTTLKLYTGTASADRLLREVVAPLARELIAGGAADRWFFMRYADPRYHLRVRFHGDPRAIGERVEAAAAAALESGLAHDVALAAYHRELERYGNIEAAERLFHADSDAAIALLGPLDARWRVGVLGTYALLRDFGVDAGAFARQSREMFERERLGDPRAIAKRVRELRPGLLDADEPLLAERSRRIAPLVADLPDAAVGSFVHMWLNRLHRSENRLHEHVTYALLAGALRPAVR